MKKVKDKQLFSLLHDYFTIYLPHNKSASVHTIRSYRKTLDVSFDYLKQRNSVTLFEISFAMLGRNRR